MKVFITGGTGFIGWRLTERLISDNHDLVLISRNPLSMASYPRNKVKIVKGDILNKSLIMEEMNGCDLVFHLAAYTKPWAKDPGIVSEINVKGTLNLLEAAVECRVKRVVFTSTAGTMTSYSEGNPADEPSNPDLQFSTQYEKTKYEAERIAIEFCKKGLDVVIVNPTRVYGPGKNSESNSMTKLIRLYLRGLWRLIPGDGEAIGNYVFIDDVVAGHILASSFGKPGERYILGGSNLSFNELFTIIAESSGARMRMVKVPKGFLRQAIIIMNFVTKVTGIPPIITIDWFEKYMKNAILSSDKAIRELDYRITPACEGISKTIDWLRLQNKGLPGK